MWNSCNYEPKEPTELHTNIILRWCSCLFTATRYVLLVEHELFALPDQLSSSPIFNGIHVAFLSFLFFWLWSVLRCTLSNFPFDVSKSFLARYHIVRFWVKSRSGMNTRMQILLKQIPYFIFDENTNFSVYSDYGYSV